MKINIVRKAGNILRNLLKEIFRAFNVFCLFAKKEIINNIAVAK